MSFVHALIGTARMVRRPPRSAAGLLPEETVLLDAPDARLAPALVSAARGDHRPASELLARTREDAEWENRDRYVGRLANFACGRDEWLARWLCATPCDPDALVVGAELAVRRAWESPARAELLHATGPLIEAAAGAESRDPVPWRIALDRARGAGAPHGVFEALWAEAVRRSAHHYGCHVAALSYLSARWAGSYRECLDFAEQAAQDVLPGSLVRALPVRAAFIQLLNGEPDAAQAGRIDAAADLAIGVSARYGAADPCTAEVRNVLAYVLLRRGRRAEAVEQFRLIGPYATSFPWACFSDDPLGRFLETRDGLRVRPASAAPLRGRTDRESSRGHYA